MTRLSTVRFAVVLAVIAALFVSGVVAGAAGSTMIIGSEANNAGSANTQLLTNSSVVAFKLLQVGPGTALMGYTTPTSGATRGVYGRVDSPNGDGVQARNAAASLGTGSALHAYGQANIGIIAESTGSVPLKLIAPGGVAPFSTNSSTKVTNLNADLLDGLSATAFVGMTRDEILVGVPVGEPLQSISIDDLPNLAGMIGSSPSLTTIANRNVFLQASASVVDTGVHFAGLVVWIGDAQLTDGTVTWPIRIWRTGSELEYARPDLVSTELLELVVVASARP